MPQRLGGKVEPRHRKLLRERHDAIGHVQVEGRLGLPLSGRRNYLEFLFWNLEELLFRHFIWKKDWSRWHCLHLSFFCLSWPNLKPAILSFFSSPNLILTPTGTFLSYSKANWYLISLVDKNIDNNLYSSLIHNSWIVTIIDPSLFHYDYIVRGQNLQPLLLVFMREKHFIPLSISSHVSITAGFVGTYLTYRRIVKVGESGSVRETHACIFCLEHKFGGCGWDRRGGLREVIAWENVLPIK